jgi:hypothetical protein
MKSPLEEKSIRAEELLPFLGPENEYRVEDDASRDAEIHDKENGFRNQADGFFE